MGKPSAKITKRTPRLAPIVSSASKTGDENGGTSNLDRLIHERMRLGIVSALAVNEDLSFNDLKKLMKTTDGNLSVHARKLEEAGYVACSKTFKDRMPHTVYRLTPKGMSALQRYLDHMEALIRVTRDATN